MSFATTDPRIPPVEDCVLGPMLEKRARDFPDRIYAVFEDGTQWTYAQTLAETRRAAAGLQAIGLKTGDTLLMALPNGPDGMRMWFGANYIGAIVVHINPAYRGGLLENVIENSGARFFVLLPDLIQHLENVRTFNVETLVIFGDTQGVRTSLKVVPHTAINEAGDTPAPPDREILPFDVQCVTYTSGTTGPSKGVMCSYLHLMTFGEGVYFLTEKDRYLVNLQMYHVSGVLPPMMMMRLGGSVAVVERFRTSDFWRIVNGMQATFAILIGVMARFLLSQPESDEEKRGILKHIIQQPLDQDMPELRRRFGVDVYTSYGMTELSLPLISIPNPEIHTTCGRARDGFEIRLVDDWDCEVPVGQPGELIIRSERPWAMTHGYYRNAEATARAWRNGWFHTGDQFRKDEEGNYYFLDRLKDAIRRRGENISSFEVEAGVLSHPAIREVAAVAVKSELSEDEVMVVVSLVDGATLDPSELIGFLEPKLAYFMIPRYVRVLPDLPKTETQKIEKHVLRSIGLSQGDVWDREAAGVKVRRT